LPPRHKDTKDFILLFFLRVLVPLWREGKKFATKITKFTIKKLNRARTKTMIFRSLNKLK
jgi:hypothetical protein